MMVNNQTDERLLTVREFAEIFRRDPYTIRKWLHDSKINGIQVGMRWLIPASEVERLKGAAGAEVKAA